jgi:inosine-uridine nucleoside N-ribohydrolase
MDENNVIETTVQEESTVEPKKTTLKVALTSGRDIDIEFSYETSQQVVNRVISDADTLIGLWINHETAKSEYYQETKKKAYNTAISYLVNFNINLLDYTGMNDEMNVVYDAIAVAYAIRNFILKQREEETTESI